MKKAEKKTKPRRDQIKRPALNKKYNSRILGEFIDYDYLDKLSESELDFLNKFTEEYHKASYKHDGTDIQDYEMYGKDSNDRNNSQNRCLYGNLRNKGDWGKNLLDYDGIVSGQSTQSFEMEFPIGHNPASMEEAYVDFIESQQIAAMFEEYDMAMKDFSEETSESQELIQQLTQSPQEP
jgi:hypothetical protein